MAGSPLKSNCITSRSAMTMGGFDAVFSQSLYHSHRSRLASSHTSSRSLSYWTTTVFSQNWPLRSGLVPHRAYAMRNVKNVLPVDGGTYTQRGSAYWPFDDTMPSNGCVNCRCTSMWSLPHITSNDWITGMPSGRSSGQMSLGLPPTLTVLCTSCETK